jgi:hypothetical protein
MPGSSHRVLGPPQRYLSALAYDASRQRVVHFGGLNTEGGDIQTRYLGMGRNPLGRGGEDRPRVPIRPCLDRDGWGDAPLWRSGSGNSACRGPRRQLDLGWRPLASAAGHWAKSALARRCELGCREGARNPLRRRHHVPHLPARHLGIIRGRVRSRGPSRNRAGGLVERHALPALRLVVDDSAGSEPCLDGSFA